MRVEYFMKAWLVTAEHSLWRKECYFICEQQRAIKRLLRTYRNNCNKTFFKCIYVYMYIYMYICIYACVV